MKPVPPVLLIVGSFRIASGRLDDARPAMAAMTLASRAEEGCVEYGYAQDVLEPDLIHVRERWTGREALARHFSTDHLASWRAAWPALGISDRTLSLYDVGEPEVT